MMVFASVLLPEPFGPIRAWIWPRRTSRLKPLRISFPSTLTWRSCTTSSGVWVIAVLSGGASGREALATRTAVAHVRVVELEAGSHQAVHELDLGAGQQRQALRVHDQLDAMALEHLIAGAGSVAVLHEIRIPRASAAAHAEPQAERGGAALLHELAHLVGRERGERDAGAGRGGRGLSENREIHDQAMSSTRTKPGRACRRVGSRAEVMPATRAGSFVMPWSCG